MRSSIDLRPRPSAIGRFSSTGPSVWASYQMMCYGDGKGACKEYVFPKVHTNYCFKQQQIEQQLITYAYLGHADTVTPKASVCM